jgi:hypothetical protein
MPSYELTTKVKFLLKYLKKKKIKDFNVMKIRRTCNRVAHNESIPAINLKKRGF